MRLPKIFSFSSYTKNILALMSGNLVAQSIPMITAPINARIFSPSDYGMLGIFLSLTGIISVVATLRYQIAIVLPKNDTIGVRLFCLCVLLGAVFSLLTFLGIVFLNLFDLEFKIISDLGYWKWVLPFSVFLSAVSSSASVLLSRLKAFKRYSFILVFSTILVSVVTIGIGSTVKGPMGLMSGYLAGQIVTLVMFCYAIIYKTEVKFKYFFQKRTLLLAYTYKKFPIFSLPTDFLSTSIKQLPTYYITIISSTRELGLFNMGNRLMGMPIDLIASSFGNVFMQEASLEYAAKGNCQLIFKSTLKKLVILSLLPFIIIALIAPYVFKIFLGDKWIEAGVFSQYLMPMYFFKFISVPLIFVYSIAGKQHEDLLMHILLFLLLLIAFLVSSLLKLSIYNVLLLYSVVYSFVYLCMVIRSMQLAKGKL